MAVVLARLRMPLIYLGLAAIAVDSFLWAVAFAIYLRLGTVRRPPVEVAVPVAGRWVAWNSPGDRVAAGQQLAACGNSGNTTEPHLHFQLMDHPSVLLAAGLPLRVARYQVGGADQAGVPHNLQPFTAPR